MDTCTTGLPLVHGVGETLRVQTVAASGAVVERFYTPLDDCDVIVTRTRVTNGGDGPLTLERIMSQQLDLPARDWDVVSFTGAWVREMAPTRRPVGARAVALGSRSGVSSHYCNSFVMVCNSDACETHGSVYGFNLLWSGSHATVVEAGPYSSTCIVSGIQPEGFSWTLGPGDSFDTPEAVLAWSDTGFDGLSAQMHALVRSHVVPERWARGRELLQYGRWHRLCSPFEDERSARGWSPHRTGLPLR